MAEEAVKYREVKCPNCGRLVVIQRNVFSCKYCGYIFSEYIDIMKSEDIETRTRTRRLGDGVDRLDG